MRQKSAFDFSSSLLLVFGHEQRLKGLASSPTENVRQKKTGRMDRRMDTQTVVRSLAPFAHSASKKFDYDRCPAYHSVRRRRLYDERLIKLCSEEDDEGSVTPRHSSSLGHRHSNSEDHLLYIASILIPSCIAVHPCVRLSVRTSVSPVGLLVSHSETLARSSRNEPRTFNHRSPIIE